MVTWTRRAAVVAALALAVVVPSAAGAAGHGRGLYHKKVCGQVTGRVARCTSEVRTRARGGAPLASVSYQSGYAPADLQSAYALASASLSAGGTKTVAIVDAYDAPTAEADLGSYRSQFGLSSCTTGNGCFRKVNQSGGATPPAPDTGWAQEISLDLDMVSAICPNCHILLVEASSASYGDLATAVDRAATMGATQISNSYGGNELFGGGYESHYNHQGIDITVSSGDSGYGVEFPASSPHVTAVGGTHLARSSTLARGWFESVWSGAGSGCSSVFAKQSWQTDSGCSQRSVADVAAVADPNTGVAVYDTYGSTNGANWYVFGGTSVASPIIAAVDALAGGRSPGTTYGSFPYSNPSLFNDIKSGSNGSCAQTYLCTGVAGYDGPTGMGTPAGVTAVTATDPPSNSTRPVILGTTTEGSTLTTDNGTWTNSPTSYAYLWQSCLGATCSTVGTGSTYTLKHSDVDNTIQVTVTASNSGGPGGAATSDPVGPVAALPADFSIAVSPSSRTIRRGTSTTYTVTVSPNASFSGTVALSGSGGPAGTGISFSPSSTAATSTMTVTTAGNASPATYTLTVTGTAAGSPTHTATASLTVRKR